MNPELTKDAKKMIRAMYKNYRKKQKLEHQNRSRKISEVSRPYT